MPATTLAYSDPFNIGSRAYLTLQLTGINGKPVDVLGLLDPGADVTVLHTGHASLMGYDGSTLSTATIGTAGGTVRVAQAVRTCRAFVLGIPQVTVRLLPIFSPSSYVLWGRTDFMAAFVVTIDQRNQQFTLQW